MKPKLGEQKGLNNTARWMLIFMSVVFLILFVITGASFASLAITGHKQGHNLHERALDLYLTGGIEQARRGSILDRDGEVLASQLTSFTIFANLNEGHGSVVEDIEATAKQLSTVLNLSEAEIVNFLTTDRDQVEFGSAGRQLTFIEKEAIDAMELGGIYFTEHPRRFYPNGMFAAHTIGFTRLEEENRVESLTGQMGIELYFDEILRGTNGRIQYLRDRKGYLQPEQEVFNLQEPVAGQDVYLTLDATIQIFLENALEAGWKEANPESLVAVVADPKTGEILAMGSRSSFDPNVRDIDNFHNAVISEPFEPGSTMKVYTYAAAINEGRYQGEQLFQSGSRTLSNGITIGDFSRSWGTMTHNQGFYRSSNTAVVDMLQNWLEPSQLIEYFEAFGFGSPVGMPLSGESGGTLPINTELTQQITSGYGQGLLTTPIQHIQAMTAILNEGTLIRPQLISRIYDPNTDEVTHEFEVEEIGQPITPETARQVKNLMIGVIEDEMGSGRNRYKLEGVSSGGKTGTAQIADGARGYVPNEHIYNYVGFAPAEDPQLLVYISMTRPEDDTRGHQYVSDVYQFLMTQSLNYLGTEWVSMPSVEEPEMKQVASVVNQQVDSATTQLEDAGFEVVVIGNKSQIFAQLPGENVLSTVGRKVFIQTDIVDRLPDFTGWSRSEINQYRTLLGINIEFSGEGAAVDQSLEPGTEVGAGDTISVTLERDS